ncbi:hypothetical protein PACTADRAFT_48218 [Pachysolen tannophilus NRRL Y-2460]|uniref:Actin n=1 Tax=Pachysolen tannophilus NRRL Y-2460 TaxID=669874 RepID=A0A1E4U397_PACTA|nr:hypothetical protein PACTADRAFT_48218 [Pachysolen tannophilus NRRL Y-2460]
MDYHIPSVVIDNGSMTTRAGVSTDENPSLVFPTHYSKNVNTDEIVIGRDINNYPENEVYTLLNDGIFYNWDHVLDNWKYVYSNLKIESRELPLVITENSWNTKKNRNKSCQLAFEELEVPVFSIVKAPLCTSYSVGRSTSLIIDIGSSVTSVTPIFNGNILAKGTVHSKFAGDFLNLHVLEFLKKKTNNNIDDFLIPKAFNSDKKMSNSFKMYQINKTLADFKLSCLSFSKLPLDPIITPEQSNQIQMTPRHYLLPNEQENIQDDIVELQYEQYQLPEVLLKPALYTNNNLQDIKVPRDSMGLVELVLSSLQKLETAGDIYQQLLNNIVITGGTSFIPDLEHRVINEFQRTLPSLSIQTYSNPNLLERNFSSWIGATILSSMGSTLDNIFINKEEYEELGEDLIAERFK